MSSRLPEKRQLAAEWQDVLPPTSTAFKLRSLNQSITRLYHNSFAEHGVTPYQWLVLGCLWQEDELSVSEVTERLNQVGGTMTGILQGMEKLGLITRQLDPSDRRVAKLRLTVKGQKLQHVMLPIARTIQTDVFDCLENDEREQLNNILNKLLTKLV